MKKHLIFDLDGTLIDSSPSILGSFAYAFAAQGIQPKRTLTPDIIGPPLMQTLAKLAGSADFDVLNALADSFKSHYDTEGYKQTIAYPETQDLLETLSQHGSQLYVATNKRYLPTIKIMQHLGWERYFKGIFALDFYTPVLSGKPQMLEKILSDFFIDTTQAIYVGDRYEDGIAADYNHIDFAMVTWGYFDSSIAELQPHWKQCGNLQELRHALIG